MNTLVVTQIENGYLVQVMQAGPVPGVTLPGPIHHAKDMEALFALMERLLEEGALRRRNSDA